MLGRTHAAIGTLTSFTLLQPKKPKEFIIVGGFALIGSLIPDVDVEGSKINSNISAWILFGAIFLYVGKVIELAILLTLVLFSKRFKHRTFTHSILGLIIFSLVIGLLYFPGLVAFISGYLMHLIADSLTIRGIPIFYPYSNKCYGHKSIKTGSSTDKAIGSICTLMFIYSLLT